MKEINCGICKSRIGNLCKTLGERLELISLEKELEFKKPQKCQGGEKKDEIR